jgi:hypothetical protein
MNEQWVDVNLVMMYLLMCVCLDGCVDVALLMMYLLMLKK